MEKKIRMLLTRHPYDGHERGYNVVATGLRERGIEVILGGTFLLVGFLAWGSRLVG